MREHGVKELRCFFALPLPSQIVIFQLGNADDCNNRLAIDVVLENKTTRVGYLNQDSTKCVCLEPKWPEEFLARSHILYEKDQMACLVLKPENHLKNGFHDVTTNLSPEKLELLEKRQLVVQLSKDVPPFFNQSEVMSSGTPAKKLKTAETIQSSRPLPKENRKSVDCNNNHFVQTTLAGSFFKSSAKKKEVLLKRELKNDAKPECWPSGRWGHSMCKVNSNEYVIIGGQGRDNQMVKDSIYLFRCDSNTWEARSSERWGADRRMGHTATYDPVKNVIYVYGGSKNKRWFRDVHVLDMKTWKWEDSKAVGDAPKRAYHSSVLFQRELLVFGGIFPNPDPQPDACSDELYIFNTDTNSWYQPIVTGDIPAPRSGHSFLLYDQKKAIIFGGWDAPKCFDDVYLLDLVLMEYSRPEVNGQKPTPRSWHSSSLLEGNRVLIHGGFDGASNKVLGDSFIFDIGTRDPEIDEK